MLIFVLFFYFSCSCVYSLCAWACVCACACDDAAASWRPGALLTERERLPSDGPNRWTDTRRGKVTWRTCGAERGGKLRVCLCVCVVWCGACGLDTPFDWWTTGNKHKRDHPPSLCVSSLLKSLSEWISSSARISFCSGELVFLTSRLGCRLRGSEPRTGSTRREKHTLGNFWVSPRCHVRTKSARFYFFLQRFLVREFKLLVSCWRKFYDYGNGFMML